jgi:heme/copper-type cytochrome/quinol oxidase subunit 4
MPGAVAYIVLTLSPFFLWNKRELSSGRYRIIISGFALVTALFVGTYVKRLSQDFEIPISNYLIVGNLAVLVSLVVVNIFRIWSEKKLT